MILPDVNVLVHAHNADSKVHVSARDWWARALSGSEGVGLPWVTILGFIRITSHPRVCEKPAPVDELMAKVESWLMRPHVHILEPSDRHFEILKGLLLGLGTAGNLTTDAHLAALAMDRGYTLYSTDTDFHRFEDLRWKNPCR